MFRIELNQIEANFENDGLQAKSKKFPHTNGRAQEVHEVFLPFGPHRLLEQVHWSAGREEIYHEVHFQKLVSKGKLFQEATFSSSVLLTCSKYTGQFGPWNTPQASHMASVHGTSLWSPYSRAKIALYIC